MCLPFAGLSRIIPFYTCTLSKGAFPMPPNLFIGMIEVPTGLPAHPDRPSFPSRFPANSHLTITLPHGRQVGSSSEKHRCRTNNLGLRTFNSHPLFIRTPFVRKVLRAAGASAANGHLHNAYR
jgi:hypothetical protein